MLLVLDMGGESTEIDKDVCKIIPLFLGILDIFSTKITHKDFSAKCTEKINFPKYLKSTSRQVTVT